MTLALIIGGSGQDGPLLAQHLIAMGNVVHSTARCTSPDQKLNNFHDLDVRDQIGLEGLLDMLKPDLVFYLAAQSSVGQSFVHPIDTWDVSAFGFVRLIHCLQKSHLKTRLIYAASGDCFGPSTSRNPATETSSFDPHSPYAAAKCAGHAAVQAARRSGMHAASAFLFSHESPTRSEKFVVGKVVSAARRLKAGSCERLQLGNLNIVRDWGFAAEYVQCMALMSEMDEPEDFVVATGRSVRLQDLIGDIFSAVGCDWQDHVDSRQIPSRPADILEQHAHPAKAKRMLGWEAQIVGAHLADALVNSGESAGT